MMKRDCAAFVAAGGAACRVPQQRHSRGPAANDVRCIAVSVSAHRVASTCTCTSSTNCRMMHSSFGNESFVQPSIVTSSSSSSLFTHAARVTVTRTPFTVRSRGVRTTASATPSPAPAVKTGRVMPITSDADGVAAACALFARAFGGTPDVASAAPGRVNLIGEHVDYNDGYVFPLALEKSTYIVARAAPNDSDICDIVSSLYPDTTLQINTRDEPLPEHAPHWAAYVKGMLAMYRREGHPAPSAFQAAVVSAVPQGAGLSSSAALEMATGVLIELLISSAGASPPAISPEQRATMGLRCEHEFVHVPCGIMDQLISSKGQRGKALLIDCRSLAVEPFPLNHDNLSIVVANSKVVHQLSGSEYSMRRDQCHKVCAAIAKLYPDRKITHLRDCDMDMLDKLAEQSIINKDLDIDEEALNRARHVINEDRRTLSAADALKRGDLHTVGQLMHQSHQSLRDLFEVSTPEIDRLVDIAMSVEGVYGSRITGGGFGGCTVTLARTDCVDRLISEIHSRYPEHNKGKQAEVFATNAGVGARNLNHILPSNGSQ